MRLNPLIRLDKARRRMLRMEHMMFMEMQIVIQSSIISRKIFNN